MYDERGREGHNHNHAPHFDCPQLPGTVLRISIPPNTTISLLNLLEVTSPGGICLIVRLPFLGNLGSFEEIIDTMRQAGAKVEVATE